MALERHEGELNLGGEAHAEGDYIFQVQDGGVDYTKAEDSKKETYVVRSTSIKALDGSNPEGVGGTMVDFITVKTKEGKVNKVAEKQISSLLTYANKIDAFLERFGSDVDMTSQKFVEGMKMRLPGCTFAARVKHRTYNDRTMANFLTIWDPKNEAGSGPKSTSEPATGSATPSPAKTAETRTAAGPAADEDW